MRFNAKSIVRQLKFVMDLHARAFQRETTRQAAEVVMDLHARAFRATASAWARRTFGWRSHIG